MEVATHAGMTGTVPAPFEIDATHPLGPLAVQLRTLGRLCPDSALHARLVRAVGEVFLKNVTQAVCIAIYGVGVMCAYGSIKRASHLLMGARVQPVASGDSPCLKKVS